MEHVERMLEAGGGRIDMLLMGDDFGTQRGLLISPASFDSIFAPKKKELCDLTHSHGAFVSHHSCGSTVELWPRFIHAGMDAIQTIQPQAVGMNPYELKKKYGDKMTLHGAVDVQGWLQKSSPEEIEKEVFHLLEEVGSDGGYILSPSHNIQPDTPLENVLAMYRAAKKYRGEKPAF
jgi:uroporphyrinogen decarboxylase